MYKTKSNSEKVAFNYILAVCLAVLFFSFNLFGQISVADMRELKFGKAQERKINSGDLHEYKLTLRFGQVLFVELQEETYSVKVELLKTEDEKIIAETDLGGGYERENLIVVANDGEYLLRISASENQFGNGSYRFVARLAESLTESDKTRIEALKLLAEAATLQKENTAANIREAIKKREQALILWQNLGDKYWEGRTLDRLGTAHNALLENNKAVEYLDRTLQIVKQSGDKILEAATLNTIGSMNNGFGECQIAINYHTQALNLFKAEKHKIGIAYFYQFVGNAYNGLEEKSKAVEHFEIGRKLAKELKDNDLEARFLDSLGYMANSMDEKPKALNLFDQSLAKWSANNKNGRAGTILNIGKTHLSQKDADKALSYFNQALELYKSVKDKNGEISVLLQISFAFYHKREIEKIIEISKGLLEYFQEFNNKLWEILLLRGITQNYGTLGKYEEAKDYGEKGLKVEEIIPEKFSEKQRDLYQRLMKTGKAGIFGDLGNNYFNVGDFEQALPLFEKALSIYESVDDKEAISLYLGRIAEIYWNKKYDYEKALEYYNRSLKLAEESGNKVQIAMVQNSIGLIYGRKQESKKELEYYEKALATFRSIEKRADMDKYLETMVLGNIGLSYRNAGNPEKSIEYFNEALKIQNEINDLEYIDGKSSILTNIAGYYSYIGEKQKAIETYNEALNKLKNAPEIVKLRLKNRTAEADIINGLGKVYSSLGDKKQALEKYTQAFDIAVQAKDYNIAATILNNTALVNFDIGEKQKALSQFEIVLQYSRDIKDKKLEIDTLRNIGFSHFELTNKQKAFDYYSQALKIAQDISDKKKEADVLNGIGLVYSYLSENDKAFEYVNRAAVIYQELEDNQGIATTLNNQAYLNASIGEKGKAIELYEEALKLSREIRDKSGEATYRSNIAFEYVDLGEYESAINYFNQSLKISREIGLKTDQANALTGLGAISFEIGNKEKNSQYFNKALNYYGESLDISRKADYKNGETGSLTGLGKTYTEIGDKEKALKYLNEALQLSRKNWNKYQEVGILFRLGYYYEKIGEFDKAAEEYQEALTLAQTINDKYIESKALKGLMSVWKAKGNNSLAIFYGKQSVNKYQELRGSIRNLNRATQDIFRDKITDSYRELADILIEAGRLAEAEQVLAMLKEQENYEFTRDGSEAKELLSKKVITDTKEQKEIAEYARLADVLIAKGQRKSELEYKERTKEEQTEYEQLVKEIDEANQGVKQFFERMKVEFTQKTETGGTITGQNIIELRNNLKKIKSETGENVMVISTYLLPQRFRAIITTADTTVDRKTEYKTLNLDGKAVNNKILDFKGTLKNPKSDPKVLGKELYEIFIRPLENDIKNSKATTILWSLDGNLRYIPIGTLYDGKQYLANRFQNAVITLGSDSDLFTKPNREDWRVLGLGVSKEYIGLPGLSNVPFELGSIVRNEKKPQENQGVLPGISLLNEEFTDNSFSGNLQFKPNTKPFNVVHLATHFLLKTNRDDSGILLGDGNLLSLSKFKRESRFEFFEVDLLTLSACETGVTIGDSNGGEVESLGMLGRQKGAKSVLVTLWKVADTSTARLMSEFYRLHQANPTWTKVKSLHEAQRAMMAGKLNPSCEKPVGGNINSTVTTNKCDFSHPYYWSSFVLIGNWR